MANVLTGIRVLCGVMLLFFTAFSPPFFLLYLLGGLTDALDGTIARRQGKATDFGAKFDTAADMIFAAAVGVRMIGNIALPLWLLIWAGLIALLKAVNLSMGLIAYHRFISVHSPLNKICGAIVFSIPLLIGCDYTRQASDYVIAAACVIATAAAIQETMYVQKGVNIK